MYKTRHICGLKTAVFYLLFSACFCFAQSEIIIEDDYRENSYQGKWPKSSARSPSGGGSRYAHSGNNLNVFNFNNSNIAAGDYRVWVWHPKHKSRAKKVEHLIYHVDGVTRVEVNQKKNQESWLDLGSYTFSGNFHLQINTRGSKAGTFIGADAVKLEMANPPGQAPVNASPANTKPINQKSASALNVEIHCSETLVVDALAVCDGVYAAADTESVVTQYQWFLDGVLLSEKKELEYTFKQAGQYELILQVTDDKGRVGETKQNIEVKSAPPLQWVVDNGNSDLVYALGNWPRSSATNFYANDSLYAASGAPLDEFSFTLAIEKTAHYQVDLWLAQHKSRHTAVPHIIKRGAASKTFIVNQAVDQGAWQALGAFHFSADQENTLTVSDSGTDAGTFIGVDAIRLTEVDSDTSTPNPGTAPATNTAPAITLGATMAMRVGEKLVLNPVVDDDGLPFQTLEYRWEIANPNVIALNEHHIKSPSMSAISEGESSLTLSVSDGALTSESTIRITVSTSDNSSSANLNGKAGEQSEVTRGLDDAPYGYLEYVPKNFNAARNDWPLIIFWAGSGNVGRGGTHNLHRLTQEGLPQLIKNGRHFEAFVISPQLPSLDDSYVDKRKFLEYILTRYRNVINAKRVYVTGFSVGGGIAILNAQRHPDLIRAVVPTGAVVNRGQVASEGLLTVPSWFYHGTADEWVPFARTKNFVKELEDQGAPTRLTSIPGGNHHSAYHKAYSDDDMWEWLFSLQ